MRADQIMHSALVASVNQTVSAWKVPKDVGEIQVRAHACVYVRM